VWCGVKRLDRGMTATPTPLTGFAHPIHQQRRSSFFSFLLAPGFGGWSEPGKRVKPGYARENIHFLGLVGWLDGWLAGLNGTNKGRWRLYSAGSWAEYA